MVAKLTKSKTKASAERRTTSLDRKVRRRPELVVRAIADPKMKAKLARKNQKRTPMTWREYVMLGLLLVSVLAVGCSFAVKASYQPERNAEKVLNNLAKTYYEDYLYPRILGDKNDPAEVMAQYKESGLPMVYLRQFFTFNDGAHAEEEKYFSNEHFECNQDASRVRFMPKAPYGKTDYETVLMLECERI